MLSSIELAKLLLSENVIFDDDYGPYFRYNIVEPEVVKCRYFYPNICNDPFLFDWKTCKGVGFNLIEICNTPKGIIKVDNKYFISDIIDDFHTWQDPGQDPEPGIAWLNKNRLKYRDYNSFSKDCPNAVSRSGGYPNFEKERWGIYGLCNLLKYPEILKLKQFYVE
jgi:hypothetical protein